MKKWLLKKIVLSILNSFLKELLSNKDNELKYELYSSKIEKVLGILNTILKSLKDREVSSEEYEEISMEIEQAFKNDD